MTNLSQFLPRCLKVFLLVAGFDSQYPLCDDFPALNKHFLIKVVACIECMTDVHSYIPELDGCNGLTKTLGRFWRAAGYGDSLGSERLCLQTHTDKSQVILTLLEEMQSFLVNEFIGINSYRNSEVCPLGLGQSTTHLHGRI